MITITKWKVLISLINWMQTTGQRSECSNIGWQCRSMALMWQGQKKSTQPQQPKKIMTQCVETFHGCSTALRHGKTWRAVAAATSPKTHQDQARPYISHTNPTLLTKWFRGHSNEYKMENCSSNLQSRYVFCRHKQMKAKNDGAEQIHIW